MSLLAVQGGATGTGTVTLLAPVTNTNRTLTLPDVTDTVAGIAATQTLTNKTLTSPTLTTPNLGTPSALVGTNITGTATAFTASNVTTNANLTGDVTSVGNASTLATVNSNVGAFTNANITVNAKGLVTAISNGTAGGTVTSVAATVPAFLSVTGSPVTTSGTLAISLSGTALPLANGGTAATSASAARTSLGLAIGTDVLAPTGSAASLTSFPTLNQNTTGSAATVTGNATGSTFGFNSGYGSVATAYGCRAWVNFNGTGTVAIRGSGNVSSITDNGTGDYTVNFTTAMSDANYAMVGTTDGQTGVASDSVVTIRTTTPFTTTTARFTTNNFDENNSDKVFICCLFFR